MMNEHGLLRATETTLEASEYVANKLNDYNISHLFLMQQLTNIEKTPIVHMAGDAVLHHFREIFKGQIVGNSGISIEQANRLIAESVVDAVAFGRDYIANPDLVERIRLGARLNEQRPEFFYGDTPDGFIDYPVWSGSAAIATERQDAEILAGKMC